MWDLDQIVLNSGSNDQRVMWKQMKCLEVFKLLTGCSLLPGSFLADELDLLDEISSLF